MKNNTRTFSSLLMTLNRIAEERLFVTNYQSHPISPIYRGYLVLCVCVCVRSKLFHRVDTNGNILTRGAATCENITNGVQEMK